MTLLLNIIKKDKYLPVYVQSCTQTAVKTSDKMLDELTSSIKKKGTLSKQLIKAREKTAVAQAEELQLEEITKLRKRDSKLEQLSHMDDNIHFIEVFAITLCIICMLFQFHM